MITTDHADFAVRLRSLRFLGVTRDAWKRYGLKESAAYDVTGLALKHNMTDLQAALGIVQLGKLERFNARRRQLALRYLEELQGMSGLILPNPGNAQRWHAWHLFVVRTVEEEGPYAREAVVEALRSQGISTGIHFIAISDLTYFKNTLALDPVQTPNAVRAGRTVFSLPLYPGLSEEDQGKVITSLRQIFNG